jgi:hypothetical protein
MPAPTKWHEKLNALYDSAAEAQRPGIARFLSSPMEEIGASSDGLIPQGQEAETRIDLAERIRNSLRVEMRDPSWDLSAVQFAALMMMPIDRLRTLAHKNVPLRFDDFHQTLHTALLQLTDLIRHCRLTLYLPQMYISDNMPVLQSLGRSEMAEMLMEIKRSQQGAPAKKPKSTSRNSTGKRTRSQGCDPDAEYDPHPRSLNSAGSINRSERERTKVSSPAMRYHQTCESLTHASYRQWNGIRTHTS